MRGATRVHRLLATAVEAGSLRAASLAIVHNGVLADRWACGSTRGDGAESVTPSTRFLVASLTKPVAAAATMRLVEEGELTLWTPVASLLPAFAGAGRDDICLWHLLTHTSGLPDMVPDNLDLRARRAGLEEFFTSVCRVEPLFAPGTSMRYQSMGFLVMAKVVERVSGMAFRDFVMREILRAAGIAGSWLGLPDDDAGLHDAEVELPAGQIGTQWHWNTPYWRRLGAPWGGLSATAADLAAFLTVFLREGRAASGIQVLSRATVEAMTRNWFEGRGDFAPFGLGWMIRGDSSGASLSQHTSGGAAMDPSGVVSSPGVTYDRRFFGDLVSERAFGHIGATGCAMWADPRSGLAVAVLTSSPTATTSGILSRVANAVASSYD